MEGRGGPQGRVFRHRDQRSSYAPYQRDHRGFRQQNHLCKNCKRPGHFARECPNDSVCNNCGQAGHMAANCNSKTMCWNCKEPGHLSTECLNQPICHSCGKMGHLARECPKSSDPRVCSNCFQAGHMVAECVYEKACNKCHKPGHLARDCLNDPICNICNISGHVARQCPNTGGFPPAQSVMAGPGGQVLPPSAMVRGMLGGVGGGPYPSVFCRNCGRLGHMTHDCMYMMMNMMMCSICGGRGHRALECPSGSMMNQMYRRF